MIGQSGFSKLSGVCRTYCYNVLRGTCRAAVLACLPLLAGPVSANDDPPTFSFGRSSYVVNEGESVRVTVKKEGDDSASVGYTTTFTGGNTPGNNATPNEDYTHVSGTLDYDEDDTEKTISIATTCDTEYEVSETFALKLILSPASDGKLGSPKVAGVKIVDPVSTVRSICA